jgi:hypothetical protein
MSLLRRIKDQDNTRRGYLLRREATSDNSADSADIQIQKDANVHERTEFVGQEEFPLDNRFGTDVIVVEHEVSKTVSNEISVEFSLEGHGEIGARLYGLIQMAISAHLSKQTGHTIGESITRRHTLRLAVQPGQYVVYTLVWKQRKRTGQFTVLANQQTIVVPYQASFDLSYEIKSELRA